MILLTANRSMKDEDSLEQVMREENTPSSLPVVTIGNADRGDIVKSGVRQTIKRRPVPGLLAGYPPQLVVHL
jgi:hypothetical protein